MADSKLTALSAATSATTDDLLYVVDNPGGTPVSKKITFDNLQQSITKVGTITTGTWNGSSIGAAYGGLAWGGSIAPGAGNGLTIAMGASTTAVGLQITSSGSLDGNTGFGLQLWDSTAAASANDKLFSAGFGASYTEAVALYSKGYLDITRNVGTSGTLFDAHILAKNSSGYVASILGYNENSAALNGLFYAGMATDDSLAYGFVTQMNSATGGGLLMFGTGSTSTSQYSKHATLWGNTAANANKVLSIGNGSSFTENFYVLANGTVSAAPSVTSGTYHSITVPNSVSDATVALGITAGNTQSNQSVLVNLQLGTSTNVTGLLIQGTGSQTGGASGTGKNHVTLWGNTASNENYVLLTGNGTSFTQTFSLDANGCIVLNPAVASSGYIVQLRMTNGVNGGLFFTDFPVTLTDQKVISCVADTTGGSTVVNRTTNFIDFTLQRGVNAATTKTDSFDMAKFRRDNVTSNASANLTASGSVVRVELVSTQSSGTLTDSTNCLFLKGDTTSTGYLIRGQVDTNTEKFNVTMTGNVIIGASAAGSSAVNVLALSNSANAPSTSTDLVQLYAVDISAGNASLGIYTETAVVTETVVSDTTLTVKINGTNYKICLKA